jgi:hypothetical protein
MKITHRHGYYADVEYILISAELQTDLDFPYFKLTVVDGPRNRSLYGVSLFYENGKTVFQCPENF